MRSRQTVHATLSRFVFEHGRTGRTSAKEGSARLPLKSLLSASAGGLLVLTLAGCGSSVNYVCKDNLCTANAPAAQVQLSAASYTTHAGTSMVAAPVTLVVTRSGEGEGAVSVHFATSDGTGVAGVDYTANAGTLHWAAGDKTPRTLQVFLKNQPMRRTSRTFAVSLSSPSEGAILGSQRSAMVTVEDDAVTGE